MDVHIGIAWLSLLLRDKEDEEIQQSEGSATKNTHLFSKYLLSPVVLKAHVPLGEIKMEIIPVEGNCFL